MKDNQRKITKEDTLDNVFKQIHPSSFKDIEDTSVTIVNKKEKSVNHTFIKLNLKAVMIICITTSITVLSSLAIYMMMS